MVHKPTSNPLSRVAQLELLEPPEGAPLGERVTWPGYGADGHEPEEVLNPKKKIFETVRGDGSLHCLNCLLSHVADKRCDG